MTSMSAKAVSPADKSGAIVVSFDARWLPKIENGEIKAVIRKTIPKSSVAKWMYLYVNSPIAAFIARARLSAAIVVAARDAYQYGTALSLDREELEQYIGKASSIGLYKLQRIEIAHTRLSASQLKEQMVFHPPQNFLFLSTSAKEYIDSHASFAHTTMNSR